ncbi:DNA ligase [Mycena olivaceomarginata]|nr:DNA ligase [Mycena olivaceomarginata]
MAADSLAEIDGHKPKVFLRDGESREAKASHGYTYKVKRTQDHYYCHCPTGVPVNARTCEHLGEILGDAYEAARLELNNPGAKSKAGSSKGKRKRNDDDDDEEDDDVADSDFDDDEDDEPPQKKRKPVSKAKSSPAKGKGKKRADSDDESDAPPKKKASKPVSKGKGKAAPKQRFKKEESDDDGEDFSDEINAVGDSDEGEEDSEEEKPKKKKAPAKKAAAKKQAPKKKQTTTKRRPVKNARYACLFLVHMHSFYSLHILQKPASKSAKPPAKKAKKAASSEEEDESPKKKKPAPKAKSNKLFISDDEATEEDSDEPAPKKKAQAKPVSKGKKKKDDSDEEAEDVKPRKPVSKPKSKSKKKQESDEDEDEAADDDDKDVKPPKPSAGTSSSSDPLAEINGCKPKVLLADGDERQVKSSSSNSTYKIKRTWDHYYCQCPAWRNQACCILHHVFRHAGAPVDARTCKHLREFLGDAYEAARLKWRNPSGPALKPTSKAKPKSKGKGKKKAGDDDDDDDDDDDSGGKKVPELLLANKWDIETGPDPTGWWISEKLDGVRTFYDGKGMVSRLGNPFTPPQWFLDKLPKDATLDGELFGGRGNFQDTVSIVKTQNSPHWKNITFQIFDVPSEKTPFEDRVAFLQKLFGPGGKYECPEVILVEHEKAKSRQHVLDKLKEVETLGGEGLMLRKAKSKYEGRRSSTLLKIKTFYDAEAEVTGYTDGKGKHAGLTGALKCKMQSGKTFNVGTGLSDQQRKNPPKVGTIITYRFQELTRDGVPRFPSFLGEAIDKKKAKDAKLPAHRKAGGSKDD